MTNAVKTKSMWVGNMTAAKLIALFPELASEFAAARAALAARDAIVNPCSNEWVAAHAVARAAVLSRDAAINSRIQIYC